MARETPKSCAGAEEMQRGDRFLAAYATIEQALRRMTGAPAGRDSFRHLVDDMARGDAVIGRFRDDLAEFGELRNAIVHERISPDYLIAVPLEETVLRIEEIARLIVEPPAVYPMFRKKVVVFAPQDSMGDVFRTMSSTGFTQFPIYEDGVYRGLLTDGGIARWVARAVTSSMSLSEVPVGDVLSGEKNPRRARFISRRATIYEAEDAFRESAKGEKWRVSAVLITENGNPEEALLGIIAPSDILSFPE